MPLPEERGGGALRRRPMCVARGKVRGYKMAFTTSRDIVAHRWRGRGREREQGVKSDYGGENIIKSFKCVTVTST